MPSHLNFMLHKNFLHASSQPNTCSQPIFTRTAESSTSNEYSSIQKGSAQCTMGASNICYLLSPFLYSIKISTSKRDASFKYLPCQGIYGYFSISKLVFKPVALLFEDRRSKKSCKRNIKATLLLIESVYQAFQRNTAGTRKFGQLLGENVKTKFVSSLKNKTKSDAVRCALYISLPL